MHHPRISILDYFDLERSNKIHCQLVEVLESQEKGVTPIDVITACMRLVRSLVLAIPCKDCRQPYINLIVGMSDELADRSSSIQSSEEDEPDISDRQVH